MMYDMSRRERFVYAEAKTQISFAVIAKLISALDSTIPPLSNYKISSLKPSPVAVQPGLCQTWSKSTLLVSSRQEVVNKKLEVFNTWV